MAHENVDVINIAIRIQKFCLKLAVGIKPYYAVFCE